jgi:uncharacterized membrane protein YgcG
MDDSSRTDEPHAEPSRHAEDDAPVSANLYPPRDKRARKLMHELQRFKKNILTHGSKVYKLTLPPMNSYGRACAHDFAQRLGMRTESVLEGQTKVVHVHFEPPPSADADGQAGSAAEGDAYASSTRKRKVRADEGASGVEPGETSAAANAPLDASTNEGSRPPKTAKREFLQQLGACAKFGHIARATEIFEEMQATGALCSPQMCAIFLHIYSEAATPMLSEAKAVFAAVRASGGVPEEPAWSGLVKLHCLRGEAQEALAQVDVMVATGVTPRLRTFSPLFTYAAETSDHALAGDLLTRVVSHSLSLSVSEHLSLMKLARESERADAMPEALVRMSKEGLALTEQQAQALQQLFPPVLAEGVDGSSGAWSGVACTCDQAGLCSYSGRTLQAIELEPAERATLSATIPTLIGPKHKVVEFAKFTSWLSGQMKTHGPYSFVFDAANIGFYGHSKSERDFRSAMAAERKGAREEAIAAAVAHRHGVDDGSGGSSGRGGGGGKAKGGGGGKANGGGRGGSGPAQQQHSGNFSYRQIDALVQTVCSMSPGARVLVVLHVSHTDPKAMSPSDAELLRRWKAEGMLFTSPAGMNDDWYWLHAAVASGENCRVISNDEMRDHHFGMLQPALFVRWKERHVLHFDIPVPSAPELVGEAAPRLLRPLPYSHVMQGSAGVWHVPVQSEEGPHKWVCLHQK